MNLSRVVSIQVRGAYSAVILPQPSPTFEHGLVVENSAVVKQVHFRYSEEASRAGSARIDNHLSLLAPINPSQQHFEEPLEVISAPTSTASIVELQQIEHEGTHSSCCESFNPSENQENRFASEAHWSTESDPLLGDQWVVQPEIFFSNESFNVPTARFQLDQEFEIDSLSGFDSSSRTERQEFDVIYGNRAVGQAAVATW